MKLSELVESKSKLKLKPDKTMRGYEKGRKKGKIIYVSPYAYAILNSGDDIMVPSVMRHMDIV